VSPKSWTIRLLLSLGGGTLGALLVALVEARAATASGAAVTYGDVLAADLAVLGPVALALAAAVAALAIYLEPQAMTTLRDRARRVRGQPVLLRARTAAVAPLVFVGFAAWCVIVANVARGRLVGGAPGPTGIGLAAFALAVLGGLFACGLALLPPLRRALAAGAERAPRLLDPIATGTAGALVAAALLAVGLATGDVAGDGPAPLAVFGVLKRNELDLRPIVNLIAIAVSAYAVPMALSARPRAWGYALLSVGAVAASLALTDTEAHAMNQRVAVAHAVEQGAPLGKLALAGLRRATDRDRDGASPLFAGGDCNDRDRHISPDSIDVPGNGVDEDCSGEDTPAPVAVTAPQPTAPAASATEGAQPGAEDPPKVPKDLNLIVITIDTLRTDVGFMGWTNATTPNLDKLAARGTVFDRAYSMASYTGKSVAPMMIGKYPSETLRDGGHFNIYYDGNTFVAERLQATGVHTMGAGTHWYFAQTPWGLSSGMDVWDTSAIPDKGQGQDDTSITSPELTDAAIKVLGKAENTSGRFYAWFHYFDPHAEYMPHGEAPRFPQGFGQVAAMRAAYDGEIWFTDHHVGRLLDFIAQQPWAERTAIVVTSDHGEAFLEHKQAYHGIEVYEELVRVPLIVYVPGAPPHHVKKKRSQIDLVPTFLDIMSVPQPAPGDLSGQSMVGCVLAETEDAPGQCEEKDVLIDMPDGPNTKFRRALIHGPTPGMKLIHFGGTRYELYDLASDPNESRDLSGDDAKMSQIKALFAEKKGELHEIYVKADDPPY
jgi:arylsulfatase A-like enzyme